MDLIERQSAIEAIMKAAQEIEDDIHLSLTMAQGARSMVVEIERLPSAQPDLNEWCTDCKEYDKEKHHCPRFNRVIREALKDVQPERKPGYWETYIISMLDGEGCRCSKCGFEGVPYWDFCPTCGADMRGEKHETD